MSLGMHVCVFCRVAQEDFMKAARKISDTKKLEGSSDYEKV